MKTTFMPLKAVAEELGINRSTMRTLIDSGEGPRAFKIGGQVKIRRDDLDAFLEQAVVRPSFARRGCPV
jgi:excisionase family DNA binding protein